MTSCRDRLTCWEMISTDNTWTRCEDAMPYEKPQGGGTYSEKVTILFDTGKTMDDWRINGNWVLYCEKTMKRQYGVPIAWRYADEK